MWVLWARRYSQAKKGRPCHRYRPIASQALRKTCSVRSSASGWLPARKYRYLYTRSTKRSYSSPNASGSRETTTRLTSATTVGSSGPSVSWDGSVPGSDNVLESCLVMARGDSEVRCEPSSRVRPNPRRDQSDRDVHRLHLGMLGNGGRRRLFPAYLSVTRNATMLVASSSVRPTLGSAVPRSSAGGFRSHDLRSAGAGLAIPP